MTETERIADQLLRAYEGNAWHGPSLGEVLAGVTAEQAIARPIATAHSIWEIVLHIAQWESVVARRLAGEVAVQVPPEEDWPRVNATSEEAWHEALQALEQGNRRLREAIASFPEPKLAQTVAGSNDTFYVMLHGVVQHDLYHAGQIALLKKRS
jgi:uncharacterized damage-inducible protein DinB